MSHNYGATGRRVDLMNGWGRLERVIVNALWQASGPLTIRELMPLVSRAHDREVAYNTVQTVADRLVAKGFLVRVREPDRLRWRYSPTRTREEFLAETMLAALTSAADREPVLSRFAEEMDEGDARRMLLALQQRADAEGPAD